MRHSWEQCFRFGVEHDPWATVGKSSSDAEQPGRHSSVLILDRAGCVLAVAQQPFPRPWGARQRDAAWLVEDVRLLAHKATSALRGRLVATAVVVHDQSFSDADQARGGAPDARRGVPRACVSSEDERSRWSRPR